MGNCESSQSYPRKTQLDELINTGIGEKYESPFGCGPDIDGIQAGSGYQQLANKGFEWPQNGEFIWGGLGSRCSMCSNVPSYGCGCVVNPSIGGRRGTIERVAYKGNPSNCCISQNALDGDYTCDPKYKNLDSGICDASLTDYCSKDDNIISKQICKNWSSKKPNESRNIMLDFCKKDNNMNRTECKDFCFNNPGLCDQAVGEYCSRNPTDTEFCGCFNIPDNLKTLTKSGIALKPHCNISQCIKPQAYKTKAMIDDKACPVLNICEQNLNITSADKSELKGINFSCVQETSSTPAPSPTPSVPTPSSSTTPAPPVSLSSVVSSGPVQKLIKSNNINTNILILIIVLIVLIFLSSSVAVLI